MKAQLTIIITEGLLELLDDVQIREIFGMINRDLSIEELKQFILNNVNGDNSNRTIYISESGNTVQEAKKKLSVPLSPVIDVPIPKETIVPVVPLKLQELTVEIFNEISKRKKKGESLLQLAKEFNVDYHRIYDKIKSHKKYPNKPLKFAGDVEIADKIFIENPITAYGSRTEEKAEEPEIEEKPIETIPTEETYTDKPLDDDEPEIDDNEGSFATGGLNDEDVIINDESEDIDDEDESEDDKGNIVSKKSHHKPNETLEQIRKKHFIPAKVMEIILEQKQQKGNKVDINELALYCRVDVSVINQIMKL